MDHNVANPRLLTEQALVHVAGADGELCAFGDLGSYPSSFSEVQQYLVLS